MGSEIPALSPSHWLPRPLTLIFHVPWVQAPSWALSIMRSECVGGAAPVPHPRDLPRGDLPPAGLASTPCQGPTLLTGHTRCGPAWTQWSVTAVQGAEGRKGPGEWASNGGRKACSKPRPVLSLCSQGQSCSHLCSTICFKLK